MSTIERSLIGGVLIVIILLARKLIIKYLPKKTMLMLWGIVLVRLMIPFEMSSQWSVYNLMHMNRYENVSSESNLGINKGEQQYVPGTTISLVDVRSEQGGLSVGEQRKEIFNRIFSHIARIGSVVFGLCFLVQILKSYYVLQQALPVKNPKIEQWLDRVGVRQSIQIRYSDRVKTPMTYGIFKPKIILPRGIENIAEEQIIYILTHEMIHIKQLHIIWKMIGLMTVCMHWFNPLVWVMDQMLNNDLEMICDEEVIKGLGEEIRENYALTLIQLGTQYSMGGVFSAFGKHPIKERVMRIMGFKKVSRGMGVAGVLIGISTAMLFTTSAMPVNSKVSRSKESQMYDIQKVIMNKDNISQQVLDKRVKDYIADTQDIGMVFNVINELSVEAIDSIAKDYIMTSKNYGMYYSFKPYLSDKMNITLGKWIETKIGSNVSNLAKNEMRNPIKTEKSKTKVNQPPQAIKEYGDLQRYYEETGDIQYIVMNKDKVSQEVLDEIMIAYISDTQDVGLAFNVINELSVEAIDTIAKDYITTSKNYGMYYSFKAYLSAEMDQELGTLVEKHMKNHY